MTEDERRRDLVELLANPLDQPSRDGDDHGAPAWLLPAVAAAGGAVIVLAGFAIGRSSPAEAPPTTAPAATTIAPSTTAAEAEAFPPGFTPVDDLISTRVEAVTETGNMLFVTVTAAVRRGFDPDLSAPFQGGDWRLVLVDGRTIESSGQQVDPFGHGPITAVFPYEDYDIADVEEMMLSSRWVQTFLSARDDLGDISLPYAATERTVTFDDAATIVAEPIELSAEGGTIGWELADPASARAIISVFVELQQGSISPNPPIMVPVQAPFGFTAFVNDGGQSSGTITLTPPVVDDPASVIGATISWEMTLTATRPANVTIPFDP